MHLALVCSSMLFRLYCPKTLRPRSDARFLIVVAALLGISGLMCSATTYCRTLEEAYATLGFNPRATNAHVLVLMSDQHMNLNPGSSPAYDVTTNLDYRLVRLVNSMDPAPSKILISGDVCTSMGVIPGADARTQPSTYQDAINEMACFLASLQVLTNIDQTNILWIPGNHDQGAFENDADTFRRMFPNMPAYQKFELGGFHFFLMNSGNYGEPDERQKDWARAEVAKLDPTDNVIVMTHQPPFTGTVVHRGMGLLLRELFGEWRSRWWLIDGHEHARTDRIWQVGQSRVAETTLGPASTNTFIGFTYDVGCAFMCLSNGTVAGRIYYHYSTGMFVVWDEPYWPWPRLYQPAFEQNPGLLWRRFKQSPGRTPEMKTVDATDSISWWAYPVLLEWEMPLSVYDNEATHFVLLIAGLTANTVIDCSADRTNWIPLDVPTPTNSAYSFPIPPELVNLPKAYLRLRGFDHGNNWVGAWGLATTNGPGGFKFPRLEPIPDQSLYPGRALSVQPQVTSPYSPPDKLRFTLLSGPKGSRVDKDIGTFSWDPPADSAECTIPVTIKVSDWGTPPATSTQTFNVHLLGGGGPLLGVPSRAKGKLTFAASGDPGSYRIDYSVDGETWNELLTTNGPTHQFSFSIPETKQELHRFFRILQQTGEPSVTGPYPWPPEPPFVLQLQTPSAEFKILASTDLQNWNEVLSTNLAGTAIAIADPDATRWLLRYYRVHSVP